MMDVNRPIGLCWALACGWTISAELNTSLDKLALIHKSLSYDKCHDMSEGALGEESEAIKLKMNLELYFE